MMKIKPSVAAGFLSLALLSPAKAAEAAPGTPHMALYGGEELFYRVFRDGNPVGTHTVTFREVEDWLEVDTVFELSIRFLFFSYDYKYTSTGVWQDGEMQRLTAMVDDDGDVTNVVAARQDGQWLIDGPDGRVQAPDAPALFATTHWNPNVRGVDRILNTITGKVAEVTMINRGTSSRDVGGQSVAAEHWSYTGGLETEIWYDELGRWVGMVFEARDGSELSVLPVRIGTPEGS
jgi:hypothetical protein